MWWSKFDLQCDKQILMMKYERKQLTLQCKTKKKST